MKNNQNLFPFLDIDFSFRYTDVGGFSLLSGVIDNQTNLNVSHMESIQLAYAALRREVDCDLRAASYFGKIPEHLQSRVLAVLLLNKWLFPSEGAQNG